MIMGKKENKNYWNKECDKILERYTKGIIDYEEYCELMKKEDEKMKSKEER